MAQTTDSGGMEAARRYCDALFELALEQNALEAASKDLTILAAAFTQSADLRAAAASPLIAPAQRERALAAVAAHLGLSDLGGRFVGVLAQNGRAGAIPDIAKLFAARLAAHRGERAVEITLASPVSGAQQNELIAALEAALGQKIRAEIRVDAQLLGGFKVRAGSLQFDASLRSKLDSLAISLMS